MLSQMIDHVIMRKNNMFTIIIVVKLLGLEQNHKWFHIIHYYFNLVELFVLYTEWLKDMVEYKNAILSEIHATW